MIRETIREMNKVAIGRIVLTNREHIIALKPMDKGLIGTLLRYPYEVRDEHEYFDEIQNVKITEDMLDLIASDPVNATYPEFKNWLGRVDFEDPRICEETVRAIEITPEILDLMLRQERSPAGWDSLAVGAEAARSTRRRSTVSCWREPRR